MVGGLLGGGWELGGRRGVVGVGGGAGGVFGREGGGLLDREEGGVVVIYFGGRGAFDVHWEGREGFCPRGEGWRVCRVGLWPGGFGRKGGFVDGGFAFAFCVGG